MSRTILTLIGLMLSFYIEATEFLPSYDPAAKWLKTNREAVAGIFELLEKEAPNTSIRLIDDNISFKRGEGENIIRFTPSNISEYEDLAPKNANVFFTIRNGSYFVESGTMSFCGNTQCLQQIVHFRKKTETVSCTSENIAKPSSKCTFPIITGWKVLYLKLDMDRNYEKVGQ